MSCEQRALSCSVVRVAAGLWAVAGLRTAGVEPVVKAGGTNLEQRAVVANVQANVRRLQTEKPILGDMVAAGKLKVVGAYYDLPTGKVVVV